MSVFDTMAQSDEDFVSQLRDEGRSADEILEALIARRAPAVDQQAADGAELPDAPGLLGDGADPQEAAAAPSPVVPLFTEQQYAYMAQLASAGLLAARPLGLGPAPASALAASGGRPAPWSPRGSARPAS